METDRTADLTFGGTATTLLRLGPFTLLTDPNFLHQGQRAYLGYGLWSKRRTEPALLPADLPACDAVLLSHLHGDHFDRVAKRELDHELPVLTTRQAAKRLRGWGFGAADGLEPWATRTLTQGGERLTVTAVPGTHGPGPMGAILPPVQGHVLELGTGSDRLRVYVTGDVLFRPQLREVVERCGRLDTMVIHLGGTRVLGILVTMDARQGTDLVELLEPTVTVPIHYDDYGVFRSPLSEFLAQMQMRRPRSEIRVVRRGDAVSLDPGQSARAWSAPGSC
ncbi:MBL fold metallo-hydrolase [Sporichthya brevicatena]|uniref:MBL fold metallo-hydrolase n=1 Tax=Sporichthya brevicatena TaxID=171442 RepID=A0ABN1GW60_9ACTN